MFMIFIKLLRFNVCFYEGLLTCINASYLRRKGWTVFGCSNMILWAPTPALFLLLYSSMEIWPIRSSFINVSEMFLSLENIFFWDCIISLSPSSFLVGTNLNILCVIVLVVVLFFCGSITNELCKKPINNKLCSDKKYSMDDLHQFQSCIEFVWGDLASLGMLLPLFVRYYSRKYIWKNKLLF